MKHERRRHVAFFADEADARLLLTAASRETDLVFARTGMFDFPYARPLTGSELPDVGIARSGDFNQEPTYLAALSGTPFTTRAVPQRRGGTKYAMDQMSNPHTVAVTFGGRYSELAVILGGVGTISTVQSSIHLFDMFEMVIKRNFTRVQSFYVGAMALAALHRKNRLTANIRAPQIYDLHFTP
jgi:hypothetical protein